MDINIDGFKVLGDGSLVVCLGQSISFSFGSLTFEFDFLKDDSSKRDVKQERSGYTMKTHLINFNSSLGTGLREPTQMAVLSNGERLLFNFAVHAIADDIKIFHYTWYLAPKE